MADRRMAVFYSRLATMAELEGEVARHPAATGCLCRLGCEAGASSLPAIVTPLPSCGNNRFAMSERAFHVDCSVVDTSTACLYAFCDMAAWYVAYCLIACSTKSKRQAEMEKFHRGTRRQPGAFVASETDCRAARRDPSLANVGAALPPRGPVERSSP
jgi:hypothetical protein